MRRVPEISVVTRVDLGTGEKARATLKALIPDNVNFPKGLSLKMTCRGSVLRIAANGKGVAFETVMSTLDEVLEHVSLCQKVMPGQ